MYFVDLRALFVVVLQIYRYKDLFMYKSMHKLFGTLIIIVYVYYHNHLFDFRFCFVGDDKMQ